MRKETQISCAHLETPRACFEGNAVSWTSVGLEWKEECFLHPQLLSQGLGIDGKFWKMPHCFHPLQVGSFQTPRVSVKQQTWWSPEGKCWSRAGRAAQGFQKHPYNQITNPVSQDVTTPEYDPTISSVTHEIPLFWCLQSCTGLSCKLESRICSLIDQKYRIVWVGRDF